MWNEILGSWPKTSLTISNKNLLQNCSTKGTKLGRDDHWKEEIKIHTNKVDAPLRGDK
jgi:hypothetical protein